METKVKIFMSVSLIILTYYYERQNVGNFQNDLLLNVILNNWETTIEVISITGGETSMRQKPNGT